MGMPKTRGCPYHCNNTNSAIWPVPYLPACRRLLFPLLHACNKGNRRRLHAGKCLTHAHNHHLGSGSHGQLFRPCWGSSAWLSRRTFVRTKLRSITGPGKFSQRLLESLVWTWYSAIGQFLFPVPEVFAEANSTKFPRF